MTPNKKDWIELTKDGDDFVFVKKSGNMDTIEVTGKEILRTNSAERAKQWSLALRRKKRLNVRNMTPCGPRGIVIDSFKSYINESNFEFEKLDNNEVSIYKSVRVPERIEKQEISRIEPGGVVDDDTIKISADGMSISMHVHDNNSGYVVGKIFSLPNGKFRNVFRVNKENLGPLGAVGTTPRGGSIYTVGKGKLKKR